MEAPNPQELNDIILRGQNAGAFMVQPFFKNWLDFAEKQANDALAALRRCEDRDPRAHAALAGQWREREVVLAQMQLYPQKCVEAAEVAQKTKEEYDGPTEQPDPPGAIPGGHPGL